MKNTVSKNANRPYRIEDIMEITAKMEEEISRGIVRRTRPEEDTAFQITGAYASDLVNRSQRSVPLTLSGDETEAMFNAAMAGYIGNLFSGQFTQAEAHETARKMLSSYLMFWAWNIYYQMRMDEQFTMKMRFRIGADPITGANGLTVQEIILRSTDDPTLTYTFDAAAAAMDCMNTICPISPEEIADEIADELADKIDAEETAEEDAEDDEESIPVFGMFGCSPAAFRSRIMRELYAAFPERYDAWEEEHASELFPPEEGSACTHPYSTAIQNA